MTEKMTKKNITLVIPAFNEEKNIENVIKKIIQIVPKYCKDYEVLIVNDGSEDNTGKIADKITKKEKHVRVLHNQANKGLGYSFLRGVKDARFESVMLHFGDDDCPPASLISILSNQGKADIIIPYYTNFHLTKPWFRHILSISYTHLVNYITGYKVRYYNGMTLHNTQAINEMPSMTDGLGSQSEMIIYELQKGLSYVEIPVMNQERKEGVSSALRLKSVINVLIWLTKLIWRANVKKMYIGKGSINRSSLVKNIYS